MKNAPFHRRVGYALAGIRVAVRRERSLRTQLALGAAATGLAIAARVGWWWGAMLALAIGQVIALELVNAAIEYLADQLHPGVAPGIRAAKDAAAGAVLVASATAVACAALFLAYRSLP